MAGEQNKSNDRYKGKGKWSRPRANDSRNNKRRKLLEKKPADLQAKRLNRNIEDAAVAENGETKPAFQGSGEARRPKRKVAVLIGYCGTGYHGMQVNPPEKTIEGDLFQAFVDAGAISKDNANDPKKSSFMRAARTDKGVHAAGNVVSLKLIIEDEDVVEKINSHLPDQIRVWGISRTNKAFECRKMCSSRVYEYLIPSYAFLPPKPESALAQRIREAAEEHPGTYKEDPVGEAFWQDVKKKLEEAGIGEEELKRTQKIAEEEEIEQVKKRRGDQVSQSAETKDEGTNGEEVENGSSLAKEEGGAGEEVKVDDEEVSPEKEKLSVLYKKIRTIENASRRAFRIPQERLEAIRSAFKLYEGHHNFHNFTVGKHFKDPSSQRFMKSLTVSDPKIINDTEWLSIKIHGQSFMLHQIRKMVAMVALVIRTGCPVERITQAFNQAKINIPKAPSLGLLLEKPVYDGYNSRLESFGHGGITFEPYEDKVEAFKFKHIYDKIYSEEAKENVFHGFFAFIDSFRGDPIFDYLTARGIVDKNQEGANVNEKRLEFEEEEDENGEDLEG